MKNTIKNIALVFGMLIISQSCQKESMSNVKSDVSENETFSNAAVAPSAPITLGTGDVYWVYDTFVGGSITIGTRFSVPGKFDKSLKGVVIDSFYMDGAEQYIFGPSEISSTSLSGSGRVSFTLSGTTATDYIMEMPGDGSPIKGTMVWHDSKGTFYKSTCSFNDPVEVLE